MILPKTHCGAKLNDQQWRPIMHMLLKEHSEPTCKYIRSSSFWKELVECRVKGAERREANVGFRGVETFAISQVESELIASLELTPPDSVQLPEFEDVFWSNNLSAVTTASGGATATIMSSLISWDELTLWATRSSSVSSCNWVEPTWSDPMTYGVAKCRMIKYQHVMCTKFHLLPHRHLI